MKCHYNDELELVCINESIMNAYANTLTKVFSTEPSLEQVIIGLAQEHVKSMFCANCLQLQLILAVRRLEMPHSSSFPFPAAGATRR